MSLIMKVKTVLSTSAVTRKLYYGCRSAYIKFDKQKLRINSRKEKKNADMSRVKAMKDTKRGKRCFIIGNGPSLRISDLDRLKNEDCFAANRIYQIFDQTKWRPTYYVAADRFFLSEKIPADLHILRENCEHVFLSSCIRPSIKKDELTPNIHFMFVNSFDEESTKMPSFSEDVSNQVFQGSTVTYISIQLAVYMGYQEIYLLGIDHNYRIQNKNQAIVKNEKVQNYMVGLEGDMGNIPEIDGMTLAYRKARHVCEEKGLIIKNATRGGKLEELSRVSFDELIKEDSYGDYSRYPG